MQSCAAVQVPLKPLVPLMTATSDVIIYCCWLDLPHVLLAPLPNDALGTFEEAATVMCVCWLCSWICAAGASEVAEFYFCRRRFDVAALPLGEIASSFYFKGCAGGCFSSWSSFTASGRCSADAVTP